MKRWIDALLIFFAVFSLSAQEWEPAVWPVLKQYDKDHLYRIALSLGGIGTGTVSLGGRGELRDWEIMNVPAKQYRMEKRMGWQSGWSYGRIAT